jgi:hypothetical protein
MREMLRAALDRLSCDAGCGRLRNGLDTPGRHTRRVTEDARAQSVHNVTGTLRAEVIHLASELGLDDSEVGQFAQRVTGVPWDDCGLVELHRIVDAFLQLNKEVAEFLLLAAKLICTCSVASSLPLQSECLDTLADVERYHPRTRRKQALQPSIKAGEGAPGKECK